MADRHLSRDPGRTPLFSGLGRRELAAVTKVLGERRFPAGTAILTQGDVGVGFFVISSGLVDVVADGRRVHSLGPGDHFGDFALIAETPRTATVVATTDVHCFTLTSWDFRRLVETNPTVAWRVTEAMAHRLLGAPDGPAPPAEPTPSEPTPEDDRMKSRGPVLTLIAIVSLALALLGVNVVAEPSPRAAPAAASAPAPPLPTSAPAPAPAPAEVAEPEPPAPRFPAEAAYAGRTSGDELTVAIAVQDGRAVAYVCDGEEIEAWLEGTVEGSALTLTGADGETVTGELVDDAVFGTVDVAGTRWPYAAQLATAPAGTYRGEVSVRGVQERIGWNVLQDGTVTGLSSDGSPAPPLDVASGSATLDGAPVTVTLITGDDEVVG